MKLITLLTTFIITLASSNVFAKSVEGKGLICGKTGIYFENEDTYQKLFFKGEKIVYSTHKYDLIGTSEIKLKEWDIVPLGGGKPFIYHADLNRKTLTLIPFSMTEFKCKVYNSYNELASQLSNMLNKEIKENQF